MAHENRPGSGTSDRGPRVGDHADKLISAPNTPSLTQAQQRALDDALTAAKQAYCFSANSYSFDCMRALMALAKLLGFVEEGAPCR